MHRDGYFGYSPVCLERGYPAYSRVCGTASTHAELAATAAYVLGTVPWSEYDTEPDQIMGWSPADFAAR
jgi:hypothetical protein